MKCFVIAALILHSFSVLAIKDERQLLKCLGNEEKKFHLKKDTGPLYDLNQRLISEMIQIPQAELDSDAFQEMCGQGGDSPSLKLLELSIRRGKDIFDLPAHLSAAQKSISEGMIDDYLEAITEIFLNFITQIQSQAPSAECLKEEIPQLDVFFRDIKYLQEDVDIKKIFAGRDLKIFQKLKNYPQAFERCRARIKKKLKSASKVEKKS